MYCAPPTISPSSPTVAISVMWFTLSTSTARRAASVMSTDVAQNRRRRDSSDNPMK
jgi:hypothetical protein